MYGYLYDRALTLEMREWLRASWEIFQFNFRPDITVIPRIRMFHRKMMICLSGWLGRVGKKKKRGK